MEQTASPPTPLVLSYLGLRRAIGVIGFSLPLVLALGKRLTDGAGIESSLSSYYYTGMRDVFVGAMCAIGVFLFSYHGYDKSDERAGDLAATFAIGLALVPTAPEFSVIPSERLMGAIHLTLAAGFFLTLAYFCVFLFTRTDPRRIPTAQKLQRNKIYKGCGFLIVAGLFLIVVVKQFPEESWLMALDPVYWLESLTVVAFGVSWLTKGEAILKDVAQPRCEQG